jgi:transposase
MKRGRRLSASEARKRDSLVVRQYYRGVSIESICKTHNISPHMVKYIIHKYKKGDSNG